jgi:hypothetical protein
MQCDRIDIDEQIRRTKTQLAELKGQAKGTSSKSSSFKPPKAGKVPSGGRGAQARASAKEATQE